MNAKMLSEMSVKEIAEFLKRLPSKPTYERQELEDQSGTMNMFYSGMISYSDTPVADAIEIVSEFVRGWNLPIARREFPDKWQDNVNWGNQLLTALRS